MTDAPMMQAALAYARRGWPVFPCDPQTKRPLVARGFKVASTDPAQVRAWWGQHPAAMIGVPTGAQLGSGGAFVLDLDVTEGGTPSSSEGVGQNQTAEDLIAAIEEEIGAGLPPAPQAETPRGGRHLYFALPEGDPIRNRAGLLAHVDVRGEGGYVIVPPSRRADGRAYRWLTSGKADPPPPPPELIDCILRRGDWARGGPKDPRPHGAQAGSRKASGSAEKEPSSSPTGDRPAKKRGSAEKERDRADKNIEARRRRYVAAALDRQCAAVAGAAPGTRNDALFKAAAALGAMVAAGYLGEGRARGALLDAAEASGLLADDGDGPVEKTIASGFRAGAEDPFDFSSIGTGARHGDGDLPREGAPAPPANGVRADGGAPGSDEGGVDPEDLAYCAAQPQNDLGNARRFLRYFGRDFLHVQDVGWHHWTGTHWEVSSGQPAARRGAQVVSERIHLEARLIAPSPGYDDLEAAAEAAMAKTPRERTESEKAALDEYREAAGALAKRRGARHKFAVASGNRPKTEAMLAQAECLKMVRPGDLDADPLKFNTEAATLVFSMVPDPENPDPDGERLTAEVVARPHDRCDLISKMAPVSYDPEADCPHWRAFLDYFQPDRAVQAFLQSFFGYALLGLVGRQLVLYMHGEGANGKSTFIEAIARLMGPYAQILQPEAVTGIGQRRGDQATPDLARLPGARLVRVSELPRGEPLKESLVKSLTGGEPILARHLNKGFFEFAPVFKPVMSGNDKPNIRGTDNGIWRRLKLVPWPVTMPADEQRPMEEVLAEFAAERVGILNWLIAGACRYLIHGLEVPAAVESATAAFREEQDPLQAFIDACVRRYEPGERPDYQGLPANDLYEAYVCWCRANAIEPWKQTTFGKAFPAKGFRRVNGRVRVYPDIHLHDVPWPDPGNPPPGDDPPGQV